MNKHDIKRNLPVYEGKTNKTGYDWWRHSFVGKNTKTGVKRTFFIEYFLVNPALGSEDPIFGKGVEERPSYLMINCGCWGSENRKFQRYFGMEQVSSAEGFLKITAGDCFLSETNMWGSVKVSAENLKGNAELKSDEGSMSWSLHVNKKIAFHVGYGASRPVQKIRPVEMYWHAEGMKTEFEGTVILDGVEYAVTPKSCYGYADKNWGCEFTDSWVRLSGSHLKSTVSNTILKNSAFDIGGGTPKLYGIPVKRKMLMECYHEGREFEFNFSKFWTKTKTKYLCREKGDKIVWVIKSMNLKSAIEVRMECPKSDMVHSQFQDPENGGRSQEICNSGEGKGEIYLYRRYGKKLRLIDHIYAKNVFCEYGKYLK